jgi:hypothetical protein
MIGLGLWLRQVIELVAPQQFELVASYMLGNGLQAVVIKPSAPFPFLKLPRSVRNKILQMNLTPANKGRIEIVTDSKNGGARAKDYLKEFKHRTAMATLNKKVSTCHIRSSFITYTDHPRPACYRGPPDPLRCQIPL